MHRNGTVCLKSSLGKYSLLETTGCSLKGEKNTVENYSDCFTIDTKIFLDGNLLIFIFTFVFIQCYIHVRASK